MCRIVRCFCMAIISDLLVNYIENNYILDEKMRPSMQDADVKITALNMSFKSHIETVLMSSNTSLMNMIIDFVKYDILQTL